MAPWSERVDNQSIDKVKKVEATEVSFIIYLFNCYSLSPGIQLPAMAEMIVWVQGRPSILMRKEAILLSFQCVSGIGKEKTFICLSA